MANRYAIQPGVVAIGSAQVFVDAGSKWDSASSVFTAAPSLFTTQQSIAASTQNSVNTNPVAQSVTISGGTVTAISINGGSSQGTSGTFTLQPGDKIAVTYSVAPTFTVADIAPAAGTYPFVNSVLAGYLASYPSGPQV